MDPIIQHIGTLLGSGISVAVIGPSDTGKTEVALRALAPFLESNGKHVIYLANGDDDTDTSRADIVIADEGETLSDCEHLQQKHPRETPYYSAEYLARVHRWHERWECIAQPTLFLITRQAVDDAEYLARTMTTTDWGRPVTTILWRQRT